MEAETRQNKKGRYNLRPRITSVKCNVRNKLKDKRLEQRTRRNQVNCMLLHETTPLALLPSGLLSLLLELLCEMSLVQFGKTCRFFENLILGEGEEATKIWTQRCFRLWSNKLYVPKSFRSVPSVSTYFLSIKDSTRSQFTSAEELEMQNFHFRFKEDAGEFWIERDSNYLSAPPMFRKLRKDGSFCRSVEEFDFDTAPIPFPRPPPPRFDIFDFPEVVENFPHIQWRFTKFCNGAKGQFIKVNNFPALHILRLKNWGWRLENLWTAYQTCDDDTLHGNF